MAVKLRLTRMGAKKRPMYRIVASDSRVKRDGEYLELVGTYNPLTTPEEVKIDVEKAQTWLKNGAQPTDTVKALLKKSGVELGKKKPAEKPAKATKKTTTKKSTTKSKAE